MTSLHQQHNSGISPSAEPDSLKVLRRSRVDKTLMVADSPARQQHNTNIKSHVSSKNVPKERRRKTCSDGGKESGSTSSSLRSLYHTSVHKQREDCLESRSKSKGSTPVKHEEDDSDSASDLSDSERRSVLPSQIAPPDLNLRAEVIDPSDFQSLRLSCQGRNNSGGSYPDFLPPPFNTWSLKQLAVYLNTDGKAVPRPKPVGQLERYLDRLLQMEWHQIQSVKEKNSKSSAPIPKGRCETHSSSSHSSLSSPKCILQCQRAFPLALLSSLANAPTLQLPSCTCPHCKNTYHILNLTCRSYSNHHHTRLNPILEKRGQASGFPKRSCSESRAYKFKQRYEPCEHRPFVPSSESSHLKRMQAIGNIRNPVRFMYNPDQIFSLADTFSTASLHDVKLKRSGQRSHSCLGVREVTCRARGRSEQKKTFDKSNKDSGNLSVAGNSDVHTCSSKDSVTSQVNRKQKRVEFVTK